MATLLYVTILGIPLIGLLVLRMQINAVDFVTAMAFAMVALLIFNIYDLLVLDWLLFCTIQPRAMILPGTAGLAGYRDYRFHLIGFMKGLGFTLVGGLLIAIVWTVLQRML